MHKTPPTPLLSLTLVSLPRLVASACTHAWVHQAMCGSPADAGVALSHEDTQGGKHGPAAVDQLGLAEPLQAEHLGVGSELVLGHDVAVSGEHTLNGALGVGSSVDVVLIDACTRAQKQGALQVEYDAEESGEGTRLQQRHHCSQNGCRCSARSAAIAVLLSTVPCSVSRLEQAQACCSCRVTPRQRGEEGRDLHANLIHVVPAPPALLLVRFSLRAPSLLVPASAVALTNLDEGAGLGQAQGVKATVAGQSAVQPLGAGGAGQPQGIAGVLAVAHASLALGATALGGLGGVAGHALSGAECQSLHSC